MQAWMQKDLVYRMSCQGNNGQCGECYTGETGSYLHTRIKNHIYCYNVEEKRNKSAMALHTSDRHPDEGFKYKVDRVIRTNGWVDRHVTESIVCQVTDNPVNRQMEGATSVDLYWA